ncbi:prepilin-type N-terminal cleavage/methylation domain-containing protein [Caenispirillum bisanense]|uniref:Prepilin-type N-terminal cleavage/methylation domain-containing protein n=1 Tax=Caenispirillum bisanense TaxID=414052 RepID=A0A286GY59_9PROT|nr:prepilin-type N-terminal cleavage/methylation domain-containing protein [Caenispirillum bisanense]SOE00014.1 prepilin-type N-terminal cleavage/methylation domain-containing protein [Caenispirillum bisanense]
MTFSREIASSPHGSRTASQSGFTLIEMAIVLVIIGIVVTMSFDFTQDFMRNRRIQQTEVKLATIQEALVTYASQFRRLPCPANGTAVTGQEDRSMNGTSVASCGTGTNANQARGVVPWTVLGLSQESAIDGWGNFITYRVDVTAMPTSATTCLPVRSPAASEGMNLAGCDPSTAGAIAARLENVGFYVDRDTSTGTPDNLVADPRAGILTGAAYVLISHGENGWGAISASGAVNTAPTDAREVRNTAAAPAIPGTGNAYVDGEPGSFDDLVRFATIMQVATRARLGPRAP